MKVLNLYAGIGGNRKLWEDVEVTSVEYEPKIAAQYKQLYPNDNLIVGDAHEYLLDHYREFDFIWSSPPCQTHSRTNYFTNEIRKRSRYPDMSLYQEIIFLNQFFKGKFCVENVIGYYEPLIKPTKIGRHYLWSNFNIPLIKVSNKDIGTMDCDYGNTACKIPIEQRNAVASDLGLHVLNTARGIITQNKVEQSKLF